MEELEELGRSVLVKSMAELSDGRGNLQALVKDDLLALKPDILGPFDEASEIALGLDVLTNTEVLRRRLEERVRGCLRSLGLSERCGCGLLSSLLSGGLVIETGGQRCAYTPYEDGGTVSRRHSEL